MNGEVYQISLDQLEGLTLQPEVVYAGTISSHILAGFYQSELLCIIGFIPRSFLSDEAYIWMQTMPAAKNHKLMVARHAKRVVARALELYPKIIGHCFAEDSARWLRSLGATISGDTFEIRRA